MQFHVKLMLIVFDCTNIGVKNVQHYWEIGKRVLNYN